MVDTPNDCRISSPVSTGGAGTFFEQHVAAYWLAQLLVRGIPPILTDTVVSEVSFQTEWRGWHTDDFLVVCDRPGSASQRLAGQVKRQFTVSAANDECVQAIRDFWQDFKGANFLADSDRLVLVTLRGTKTLLEHFVGLLDRARASRDGSEFGQSLGIEGFISKKAIEYCGELQKIVGDFENKTVTPAELWPFLRVLYVLNLDLHSSTRQSEAHIKILLAHTVVNGDAQTAAAVSWNELVGIASSAMAEARTFRWEDLPAELRARHTPICTNEQRVLQALREHTGIVLRGIRSTIGPDFHLERAALVQKVLDALGDAQVVLVAGPAGSGKSAVGKAAVTLLARDHFAFGFRVEEFAEPHLDRTLTASSVPANAKAFEAILGAQDRKVILVESVERLLERTTRDAFSDLMNLAADDGGMCIVLTCRDYSVEQVRTSFLQPNGIRHTTIQVPPLDDAELRHVEAAHPALAVPLGNPALRNILRNPFFLDKALGIPWSADKPVPESEREFRGLFWREIVRAGRSVPAGMDRRREEVLQEIAVRRARALSTHVLCNDLDPTVVESLRRDSLVSSPDENLSLVATAHDVLEDWAILQWLEEQHFTSEGSFKVLSAAIGAHPAVRRSYRRWVAELIERDAVAADRLFQAAIAEAEISVQFRDDTLVSLLRAPLAPDFLPRHEIQLLANDRTILKRVIHLLRVACVKTPEWLAGAAERGSIFNVPDGSAWPTVLMLVHRNLANFTPQDTGPLLGLIEDAVRGVSWWAPDIEGAEFVAGIAHWILNGLREYGVDELRKRVLKVIAKIPKTDAARFEAVLRGHVKPGERRDPVAEELRKMIYFDTEGMPAARDLPDLVTSVGAEYLLASESDLSSKSLYSRSSHDIELYFGIKDKFHFDSFPASALRGPWMHLLRYHPRKALDFINTSVSHCTDWYAHPRLPDPLEPPWEIELTFADGTTRKQWVNPRLWGLYRGITVGPYVLESVLMALESWLLELGKENPAQLDTVLIHVLRSSDSAAIAAVVASVAVAHLHAAGEALLVLLSARDYVEIDRSRLVGERQMSSWSGMLPTSRADHQVYEDERKRANRLSHRGSDLETAILNLQLGPPASRVWAGLERHLAVLPPAEGQSERDREWRLAIHRMDLRQYTASESPGPDVRVEETGESPHRYVRWIPKPPAADLQPMIDEASARLGAMNAHAGVLVWGLNALERKDGDYDPSQWAAKLDEARAMDLETDHQDGSRHGPGVVAAICVRDHWDEMSGDQRKWCLDLVCSEVLLQADDPDPVNHRQRYSMAADRSCASVLVSLLRKDLPAAEDMLRVRSTFATAITHSIDEVRWYATCSIDETVWANDRALVLQCIGAIAREAVLLDSAQAVMERQPFTKGQDFGETLAKIRASVRASFWEAGPINGDVLSTVNISQWFGARAAVRILTIFSCIPQDSFAIAAFARASTILVGLWQSQDDGGHRRRRDYETEAAISRCLQGFLLRTSREAARDVLGPVLSAVDLHSRELQSIVQGLTSLQARSPHTPQYWFLWELFAAAVKHARWGAHLSADHAEGSELLSALFLTAYWNDNVRHWKALEGYAHLVHALFEALPPTSIVLEDYALFLYHVGEQSLPEAFVRIADALRRGDAQEMLRTSNTVFLLEVLLQRHVYGRPLELKRDPTIRGAALSILDSLVDTGSSAAFRMRDDFVTPATQ